MLCAGHACCDHVCCSPHASRAASLVLLSAFALCLRFQNACRALALASTLLNPVATFPSPFLPAPCSPAARFNTAKTVVTDELKRRDALISLSYADFVEAICRVAMIKPTPHEEEMGRIGAHMIHDFVDAQVKLGRYKAWLKRAARALPPYADRSSRTTGGAMPIADELRRLLGFLEQERTRLSHIYIAS